VAVFVVASMSFAAASVAQEVADAAWGLRFVPPPGWSQQPSPEGYLYLAPDGQRLLAVLPHEAASVEALRAEAQRGLHDGYGTVLLLHGALERFGNRGLAGDFEGRIEGSPARARVIGLVAPSGPGATVLAAAAPQAYSAELAEVAADVARSVAFDASHRAESSGNSTSGVASDEAEEWTDWLEGCRLSYFNSYDSGYGGGGYIDETVIDLCPGYFTYGAHSETVFNTPDLSGGDVALQSSARGAGQWEVLDIGGQLTLRLTYHDGSTRSYALSYEDGKTFLDGRRWLRTCDPNDTVVEARPQCR
jgi:hypothetical protein